jgi:hypothetical protein
LVCGGRLAAMVFEHLQGAGFVGTLSQPVPACRAL